MDESFQFLKIHLRGLKLRPGSAPYEREKMLGEWLRRYKVRSKVSRWWLFILLALNIAFAVVMVNRVHANYYVRWQDYKTASEIDPWEWSYWFKRGAYDLAAGKTDEAIIYFRQAIEIMPYVWGPINNLAIAYGIKGDLKRADRMIEELLTIWPTNPVILKNRDTVKGLMG